MAGTDLYWGRGEGALRELVEARRIPVFLNGLARGCIPADHELFFSRARSTALKGADVALVVGVPMDFRLGFGKSFGEDTEIVVIDVAEPERDHPRPPAEELYGDLSAILSGLAGGRATDTSGWVETIAAAEREKREAERELRADPRAPLHPMRLYAELGEVLDRNAIVIGDGGDFVSYAGRVIDSYEPGCWLDPGPVRLPRLGPRLRARGEARAARPPGRAAARRRRLRVLGDGVRHARPPRRQRRRRDGQQRHLGAREAPDGGHLRLLRRRRPAARDALRPRGRGARRARRAGARAGRAAQRRS